MMTRGGPRQVICAVIEGHALKGTHVWFNDLMYYLKIFILKKIANSPLDPTNYIASLDQCPTGLRGVKSGFRTK